MLPQRTKAQAGEIRKQLLEYGWKIIRVDESFENEWWMAETWIIESEWSPQGVRAYLTYLVDPQDDSHAPNVWQVTASTDRPVARPIGEDDKPSLLLGRGWQKGLRAFLKDLDQLRTDTIDNPAVQ